MKDYFSLIKFSHTIFALPFAIIGFVIGVQEFGFKPHQLILVVLCMVFARNAAMAFNRYIDRDIDKLNPRTAERDIPSGKISLKSALRFIYLNSFAFILCAGLLNLTCLALAPIALVIIIGYSYTKRFTALCHFVLGLGLGISPTAAYLAVSGGAFSLVTALYSLSVFFWVSGFDIIYALQDEDFDRDHELHSVPEVLGKTRALQLSIFLHLLCALSLVAAGWQLSLQYEAFTWLTGIGTMSFVGLLLYQHLLVKPNDLSRVNLAFFTTNGIASLFLGALIVLDIWL